MGKFIRARALNALASVLRVPWLTQSIMSLQNLFTDATKAHNSQEGTDDNVALCNEDLTDQVNWTKLS